MPGVDNREVVRKAAITAANTLASQGKLNDAQADKFIDYVFDETKLSKVARMVKFRNESMDIDKIGVGRRAAMPATEAVDPGRRRGVTTSKISLTPKEIIVPFEVSDVFLEVNIEGGKAEDHIIKMFATQLANDLEIVYIHGSVPAPIATEDELFGTGNTAGYLADGFLGLFDGFLEKAHGGNLVDVENDTLGTDVWASMLNALPSKFRKDPSKLRFICSLELETLWRRKVAARGTAMGDAALQGGQNMTPLGIPLVPIPLLEHYVPVAEDIVFTGSGSTVALRHSPVQAGSIVIVPSTITTSSPVAPYTLTTDYTVSEANGTITHAGGGSGIGATETVRVYYRAMPQILLTHEANMIVAMGRDIRFEKDRDIFRRVNQYAMTAKIDCQIEELSACVKAFNISDAL